MKVLPKYFLAACLLVVHVALLRGQTYIGMNKDEIAVQMKSEYPEFKPDKGAVNHTFKYLKYVDKITEQTILFFLAENDVCTYVRRISDYSNLNDMIGTLNNSYKKVDKNNWTYTQKGQAYTVNLTEDEWYFTVSYRKK
ncbi:MAG TPA: hypothetical protein VJ203_07820 [Bacteroidales bacterium]|nr:hypothetical protein [Bacteroidales bacterium]